jgi:hypothetical protein
VRAVGEKVKTSSLINAPSNGPQKPWYKSCGAQAVGSFLLHGSIDALGAIPVAGEATAAAQFGLGLASTAYGIGDTSVNGSVATGLGTTGIALGIAGKSAGIAAIKGTAELVPVLGQAVAIGSVIWDGASGGRRTLVFLGLSMFPQRMGGNREPRPSGRV